MIKDGKGSSITLDATDGSITISARGKLKLEAAGGVHALTIDETQVDIS